MKNNQKTVLLRSKKMKDIGVNQGGSSVINVINISPIEEKPAPVENLTVKRIPGYNMEISFTLPNRDDIVLFYISYKPQKASNWTSYSLGNKYSPFMRLSETVMLSNDNKYVSIVGNGYGHIWEFTVSYLTKSGKKSDISYVSSGRYT